MKKTILILALVTLTFLSCSKDDSNEILNQFKGTSWTADDFIANVLYGDGCTTTIEFLTEDTCQEVKYRPNKTFDKTVVSQGSYVYNEATVTWTIEGDDRVVTGTKSGSVLTTGVYTYTLK